MACGKTFIVAYLSYSCSIGSDLRPPYVAKTDAGLFWSLLVSVRKIYMSTRMKPTTLSDVSEGR